MNVDPKRHGHDGSTGIYARAKIGSSWGAHDIAMLDRDSLHEWLRSRGGENPWAENVVLMLLGHEPIEKQEGVHDGLVRWRE